MAYAAGAVLQRAVLFLLLPFFTRVLSPAEFGQVGVITTLAAATTVIVGLGLETAVFRGFIGVAKDPGQARVFINTVGGFAVATPIVLSAAIAAFAAQPISRLFGIPTEAIQLACIGAGGTAAAILVPLAVLRSEERLGDYLQLAALQVAITPLLTILLVAVLGWGVTGWMLAYALSSYALLIRGIVILGHRWSLDFDGRYLRDALRFGIPLVPHALSHWGLSVSDRAVLGALATATDVGAYYVGYIFCLPIALAAIALSQATQPLYAERRPVIGLGPVVTVQTVAIFLIGAGVALLGPSACLIFLPTEYSKAAVLIPWLAAGSSLFGLYLIPMGAIALTAGRTQRVWLITLVAALTNVALNLILIPHIGVIAAAINTTIGYGLLLIGVYLYMRQVCDPPIPYEWKRIAMGTLVIGLPSIIAAAAIPPDSVVGLTARAAVIVSVSFLLFIGPFKREATAAWRAIIPGKAGGRA